MRPVLPSQTFICVTCNPILPKHVCTEEDTEEELLARLGVRLEAEVAALAGSEGGGFNEDIARRWGAQEQARLDQMLQLQSRYVIIVPINMARAC